MKYIYHYSATLCCMGQKVSYFEGIAELGYKIDNCETWDLVKEKIAMDAKELQKNIAIRSLTFLHEKP